MSFRTPPRRFVLPTLSVAVVLLALTGCGSTTKPAVSAASSTTATTAAATASAATTTAAVTSGPLTDVKTGLQKIFGPPQSDAAAGATTTAATFGQLPSITTSQIDCSAKAILGAGVTSADIESLNSDKSTDAINKAMIAAIKQCLPKPSVVDVMGLGMNATASGSVASAKVACAATQLYDHFDVYLHVGDLVEAGTAISDADMKTINTVLGPCSLSTTELAALLGT